MIFLIFNKYMPCKLSYWHLHSKIQQQPQPTVNIQLWDTCTDNFNTQIVKKQQESSPHKVGLLRTPPISQKKTRKVLSVGRLLQSSLQDKIQHSFLNFLSWPIPDNISSPVTYTKECRPTSSSNSQSENNHFLGCPVPYYNLAPISCKFN